MEKVNGDEKGYKAAYLAGVRVGHQAPSGIPLSKKLQLVGL